MFKENFRQPVSAEKFGGDEAMKFLQRNSIDIQSPEFAAVFGRETIKQDLATAKRLSKKFNETDKFDFEKSLNHLEQKKDDADIVEASVLYGLDEGRWLGDKIFAKKTSDFDDFTNGVDVVAEIDEADTGRRHLGLAIDATHAQDLDKKISGIANQLTDKQQMARVKYFQSPLDGSVGSLSELPKIIACADNETTKELRRHWDNFPDLSGLEKHPIRFQFAEEFVIQLDFFARYAQKHYNEKAAQRYRDLQQIFERFYEEQSLKLDESGQPIIKLKKEFVKGERGADGKPLIKQVKTRDLHDGNVRDQSFQTLIRRLQALDPQLAVERPYDRLRRAE